MFLGQPSIQSSFIGTKESMCFYDVMIGVKEFLKNYNFMNEFRIEFLNYSLFYFKKKLNQMQPKYKEEYFIKIKKFLEELNITYSEFKKINNFHIPFYIHVINSNSFEEFNLIHRQFNGESFKIQNNFDTFEENNEYFENILFHKAVPEPHFLTNKIYITFLENTINKLLTEKEDINTELTDLIKETNDLKKKYSLSNEELLKYEENNSKLISENESLKQELNKFKSSKVWKLKNKWECKKFN